MPKIAVEAGEKTEILFHIDVECLVLGVFGISTDVIVYKELKTLEELDLCTGSYDIVLRSLETDIMPLSL